MSIKGKFNVVREVLKAAEVPEALPDIKHVARPARPVLDDLEELLSRAVAFEWKDGDRIEQDDGKWLLRKRAPDGALHFIGGRFTDDKEGAQVASLDHALEAIDTHRGR